MLKTQQKRIQNNHCFHIYEISIKIEEKFNAFPFFFLMYLLPNTESNSAALARPAEGHIQI